MSYFKGRRSSSKLSEQKLEDLFNLLADAFSIEWLLKKPYHPIRELWKRNDELATNELISMGIAIEEISKVDSLWVRTQVKHMKSAERNNRQGSFAELFGINILNCNNHPVIPAKLNQAGYDAEMHISEVKRIRISIKNYGISSHEEYFIKLSKNTEQLILKLLKKYDYYPVSIVIDSPELYPTKEKWDTLHKHLDEIFRIKKDSAQDPALIVANNVIEWIVIINPINPSNELQENFHPRFKSYTIIISGAYHQNENQNLISKINDACLNLEKHSATEDNSIRNFLFIHLSPTASIKKCTEWLDNYFKEFPDKPITSVIFYQPTVPTNQNESFINHYFSFYIRQEKFSNWLPESFKFEFTVPIGLISNEPSKVSLMAIYPDGKTEQMDIDERYFYQHGEHYLKMVADTEGKMSGNIRKIASGVFVNTVIEFPGEPNKAVISGKFPPFDELLIL